MAITGMPVSDGPKQSIEDVFGKGASSRRFDLSNRDDYNAVTQPLIDSGMSVKDAHVVVMLAADPHADANRAPRNSDVLYDWQQHPSAPTLEDVLAHYNRYHFSVPAGTRLGSYPVVDVEDAWQGEDPILRQALRAFEITHANDGVETAAFYGPHGEGIYMQSDGKKDQVSFSDEKAKLMKGAVLAHNHPSSSPFSVEDIGLTLTEKGIACVVVAPKARYIMKFRPNISPSKRNKILRDMALISNALRLSFTWYINRGMNVYGIGERDQRIAVANDWHDEIVWQRLQALHPDYILEYKGEATHG